MSTLGSSAWSRHHRRKIGKQNCGGAIDHPLGSDVVGVMDVNELDLKGVNLYLIGMMGAGKSTTGRLMAQQLHYYFFDTDDLITQLTGQSIPQIFAEAGEASFRRLETQVLASLAPHKTLVVATGGGIVLEQMNWSYLRHGLVVWLDVPLAHLWARLQGDQSRPLLQDVNPHQTLKHLLEQRRHLYAQADVHVVVDPSNSPDQVLQSVLSAITKVVKSGT